MAPLIRWQPDAGRPRSPPIRRALAALDPAHRHVLVLSYRGSHNFPTGPALGVPEHTVESRRRQALRQLRERLAIRQVGRLCLRPSLACARISRPQPPPCAPQPVGRARDPCPHPRAYSAKVLAAAARFWTPLAAISTTACRPWRRRRGCPSRSGRPGPCRDCRSAPRRGGRPGAGRDGRSRRDHQRGDQGSRRRGFCPATRARSTSPPARSIKSLPAATTADRCSRHRRVGALRDLCPRHPRSTRAQRRGLRINWRSPHL